jgi:hypothetical protein
MNCHRASEVEQPLIPLFRDVKVLLKRWAGMGEEMAASFSPVGIAQRALMSDEEPGRAVHPCQLPGLVDSCRRQAAEVRLS